MYSLLILLMSLVPLGTFDSVTLQPGKSQVAFWYVNLSGKLHYKVTSKSGKNWVKAWWVKGPFGTVEGIPELVNNGTIVFKGIVWGKLKVEAIDSETVVQVSEDARVAANFPTITFK